MSDKYLLANPTGFRVPSFCFCHNVAPSTFVLASVVIIFSFCALYCARHGILVIPSFNSLNAFVCSSVQIHSFCFFNNFLSTSVFADRFSMYFDKYCIAPRIDFNSFSFFGMLIFVMASSLSCSRRIPCWSILCPTNSISFLKNSNFFGFSQ